MVLLYLRYTLLGLAMSVVCVISLLISLARPTDAANTFYVAKMMSFLGRWIMGIHSEIEGLEHLKDLPPGVLVSNHQSNLDIFIVGLLIPRRTVSVGKKSILYIPVFGQMYWLSGNILIDRGNKKQIKTIMDKVVKAITTKKTIVWFMPEGTRSKGRGVQKFKKGAFTTALKSNSNVTPICFSTLDKHVDCRRWNSGVVKIKILPTVDTSTYSLQAAGELADHCWQLVSNEVKALDNSY